MSSYATVLYPNKPDSQFNLDYYLSTHMPLVAKHWGPLGLKSWKIAQLNKGLGGAEADFIIQAILEWESADAIQTAVTSESAQIVFGDVPNFTNLSPIFAAGTIVGSG